MQHFQVLNILKDLYTLDQELQFLNYIPNIVKEFKSARLKLITVVLLIILVLSILVISEEVLYRPNPSGIVKEVSIFVVFSLPLICTTFMLLQFCAILVLIKQRYRWLNQKIEDTTALCNKHMLCKRNASEWPNEKYSL